MGIMIEMPHCGHDIGYGSFFRFRGYTASLLDIKGEYRAVTAPPYGADYSGAER